MGRDTFEEGEVPHNGNIEGEVQGRNRGEVEYDTLGKCYRLRYWGQEVGEKMVGDTGGRNWDTGGLGVSTWRGRAVGNSRFGWSLLGGVNICVDEVGEANNWGS